MTDQIPAEAITAAVQAAQDAEQQYARNRRPDGGNWRRVSDEQFARMLTAAAPVIAAQAAAAERERWHASLANLHRPFGIHDECYCKGGEHTGTTVTNCGEFETCLPPTYLVCRHCCCDTDDCYQTEACVDSHDHGPGEPICETAALVAALLGDVP